MYSRAFSSLLLLSIFLASCNIPTADPDPTIVLTDEPVVTEPPIPYPDCYFNWATQALPELSDEVQSALEAAGLTGVTATAEAYGENCYDSQTNEVAYFAAMETDFRIQVEVPDLADIAHLGALLEQVLEVLDGFPNETTPGSQPGYIGVNFAEGQETLYLWFTIIDGESARALGLHGAELLEELQNR